MSAAVEWWIEADGRAYGPYLAARLPGFVREGRLGPSTPVARSPRGPFAPAAAEPALLSLFEAPPERAPTFPGAALVEPGVSTTPAPAGIAAPVGPLRTLLVGAELGETGAHAFAQAVAEQGPSARAGAGLWLVRTAQSPATLRNALSRALRPGDRLLVVEAALADAAWFNLDGEADLALRRLWAPVG